MNNKTPTFKVVYSTNPMPELLKAEFHIKFIKHLVQVVKEQEALSKNKNK